MHVRELEDPSLQPVQSPRALTPCFLPSSHDTTTQRESSCYSEGRVTNAIAVGINRISISIRYRSAALSSSRYLLYFRDIVPILDWTSLALAFAAVVISALRTLIPLSANYRLPSNHEL